MEQLDVNESHDQDLCGAGLWLNHQNKTFGHCCPWLPLLGIAAHLEVIGQHLDASTSGSKARFAGQRDHVGGHLRSGPEEEEVPHRLTLRLLEERSICWLGLWLLHNFCP